MHVTPATLPMLMIEEGVGERVAAAVRRGWKSRESSKAEKRLVLKIWWVSAAV